MGRIFDQIFNRKNYHNVTRTYDMVLSTYRRAYELFIAENNIVPSDSYEYKRYITESFPKIQQCAKEIQEVDILKANHYSGFNHFCKLNKIDYKPIYHHRIIFNNRAIIKTYHSTITQYFSIEKMYPDAIKVLYGTANVTLEEAKNRINNINVIKSVDNTLKSYAEIERNYPKVIKFLYKKDKLYNFSEKKDAVEKKSTFFKINSYIEKAESIKKSYPKAWKLFLKLLNIGGLYEMSIDWLKWMIDKNSNNDLFKIKEKYLSVTKNLSKTALEYISPQDLNVNEFSFREAKYESQIIEILSRRLKPQLTKYEAIVANPTINSYARVILDDDFDSKDVSFNKFGLEEIYSLSRLIEKNSTSFYKICTSRSIHREAIKAFNKQRTGVAALTDDDFIKLASKDPQLMRFIENYENDKRRREEEERKRREDNERQETISKAKSIANSYSKGFKHFFPNLSSYYIDYSSAKDIIWKETQIKEWSNMMNCVSSWDDVKGIPYYFFWYYYPKRFSNVSLESERARKLIWNFKDGETTSVSIEDLVIRKLRNTFGASRLKEFTFVCIPASTKFKNEIRYKYFSSTVCDALEMRNAYPKITIIKEKTPAHLSSSHVTEPAEYSFDTSFFRGAKIILFDDVITTGHSMAEFKRILEKQGAYVICAISIGRTYSDYYGDNRKPHPYTGTL